MHTFSHISFPNHVLNWECSKVEKSCILENVLKRKMGEIHFHEKLYNAYCLFLTFDIM